MSDSSVQPTITVLSPSHIEQIHRYSLEILAQVGVRIDSPRVQKILTGAEGVRFIQPDQAVFEPDLVNWAIQSVPSVIDIFNRQGDFIFSLGADRTRFGIGVTNLYYQDPVTEELSLFTRKYLDAAVRLGTALPGYNVISTVGVLRDVGPETADLYATLEMIANTTKPLVILISDGKLFVPTLDLLQTLHGDLASKPFVIPYLNPVTPLVINEETGDKLLDAVEWGLPFIYSNYGMVGMSTPVTPAGTLALLNAELLAGLVLSQLAKPGAPIILGSLPAYFDMKTMVDFYDPHTMLLNLACAEMMAHYRIPHAGTSGSGNGWGADLLGSGALWMNHLTSCLGKVGLAPFVGGNLGSKAFSPTLAVYSNEVIEQALRFAQGFVINEETIALDDVFENCPGGGFIMTERTFKLFREVYHMSDIFPRWSLEVWEEKGRPEAVKFLKDRTMQLVNDQPPPDDHDSILERGEYYIQKWLKNG